jgi:lactoylglutathione lyase
MPRLPKGGISKLRPHRPHHRFSRSSTGTLLNYIYFTLGPTTIGDTTTANMTQNIHTDRPFKVLGIQQVAIGGTSKAKLRALWVDMLGLDVTGSFRSERENVDEDICAMGSGAFKVEVDLMEPIDTSGKPAVHITPLNHVGLWIDDLPKAVEWLTANGVRFAPGGIRKGAAGFDITFLHPKSNDEFPIAGEGVLIELVQAPIAVINAFASISQ